MSHDLWLSLSAGGLTGAWRLTTGVVPAGYCGEIWHRLVDHFYNSSTCAANIRR